MTPPELVGDLAAVFLARTWHNQGAANMTERPSPVDLWRQAGGGTSDYSADRYRALMLEHGLLVPGTPEPLPCGWTPGAKTNAEELPPGMTWVKLSEGRRITDPDDAERLGLPVEARRLRSGELSSGSEAERFFGAEFIDRINGGAR